MKEEVFMDAPPDPHWIFDPIPASGARTGGLAQAHVLPSRIDTFVREVLQNAADQRRTENAPVRVRFQLAELTGPELEAFLQAGGWTGLVPHIDAAAAGQFPTISHRLRTSLDRWTGENRMR